VRTRSVHSQYINAVARRQTSDVGCKAVTRGVFWVFEHPRNFREKLDKQKQIYY